MSEPPQRVVTRALVARALVRSALAAALVLAAQGVRRDSLVLGLHVLAAVAGATALERVALLRSRRRHSPARCAVEAGVTCAALHAALLANAVWWFSGPALDLQAKADAVASFLEREGPATTLLLLAGTAWALAGPSCVRVLHARGSGRALTNADLPWLVASSLPLACGSALLDLDAQPLHVALGSLLCLVGLSAAAVLVLARLDRLARWLAPERPDAPAPA